MSRPRGGAWTTLADQLAFPEGPVELEDGTIAVVEMAADRITLIGPGDLRRSLACRGGPNGLTRGRHGRELLVALNGGLTFSRDARGGLVPGFAVDSQARGGLVRLDLDSGDVDVLIEPGPASPLSGPNDLALPPPGSPADGGVFITDLGRRLPDLVEPGGVYWFGLHDRRLVTLSFARPGRPNGIALSPDGGTLYVAESASAQVWEWSILGPGQVGPPRLLHTFDAPARLDGMAVTSTGRVVCTNLVVGHLAVLNPAGEVLQRLAVDDPFPTNVITSGGCDDELIVTLGSTGRLVRVTLPPINPWT